MMRIYAILISFLFAANLPAATAEQIEFFEKKIRPVLAESCYSCHSAETMALGELRVDTAASLAKGGTRGPAVVPGDPAASVLLRAVSYGDLDLKMPPTGKLSDEQIADFRLWIEMGAPDPRQEATSAATPGPVPDLDLDEARKFWSFQPLSKPAAPAVSSEWVRRPVDAFILAKLRENGLEPAPLADKRSLIRRVTFDLTGLPPTRDEIGAFLADESPDAYEKLVERLLDSPHYGERWARHWLDLVRYAETNGHEFDNNKPDAWRYRDYVVRAFNQDLPYDRFVREQIAGDLLPDPRLTPDGTRYDTPIGAGFYWLWEVLNSPTDSEKARADQVDNQIDVLGKAIFGLTLACARCHDHKFDPLLTKDYYALAGIMHSTNLRERDIDSPETTAAILGLRGMLADMDGDIRRHLTPGRRARAQGLAQRLLSDDWADYRAYAASEPSHPLYPLAKLAGPSEQSFSSRLEAMRAEMRDWRAKADRNHPMWAERGDLLYEDFSNGYGKWDIDGAAFGEAPSGRVPTSLPLTGQTGSAMAVSYAGADEFVGLLATRKFTLPKTFIHVRMAGTGVDRRRSANLRFTVWADDHPSQNMRPEDDAKLQWTTVELVKEEGRLGYLQIVDRDREGYIAVDQIVFSDSEEPPPIAGPVHPRVLELLDKPGIDSIEALARGYQALALELIEESSDSAADQALAGALEGPEALDAAAEFIEGVEKKWASDLLGYRRSAARGLPETAFAMSTMDHDPHNVRLHQRGNHKNLGEEVPRGFLTLFADEAQESIQGGSGRLQLADWAVKTPLTPRVMVNRVWKHHFGTGLVGTPDNFGKMGDRPTHPELLEHLASEFVQGGWSVKNLHREILLSNTYRLDSRATEKSQQVDPTNKLLSHMPVRRLEAEAIRDSVLAVAGTLNREVGGPSVPPHVSEFQDGRGKPQSGPLDGEGRRSLYIGVRRNFLTPLFLAFDYPSPMTTIGRRGVSASPPQALIMLNNEFINQQAQRWAKRELERFADPAVRIEDMFESAFGRPPADGETAEIRAFLDEQRSRYETDSSDDERAWTDLAHVLINTTEFIFVR